MFRKLVLFSAALAALACLVVSVQAFADDGENAPQTAPTLKERVAKLEALTAELSAKIAALTPAAQSAWQCAAFCGGYKSFPKELERAPVYGAGSTANEAFQNMFESCKHDYVFTGAHGDNSGRLILATLANACVESAAAKQ